jgi:hypothetical protein
MFPISKTPGLTAEAVLTEWAEMEFAIYLAGRSSSCMLEQGSQGISIPSGCEHEVLQEASLIRALIVVQPGQAYDGLPISSLLSSEVVKEEEGPGVCTYWWVKVANGMSTVISVLEQPRRLVPVLSRMNLIRYPDPFLPSA